MTLDGNQHVVTLSARCTLCGATAKSEPILLLVKWPLSSGMPWPR